MAPINQAAWLDSKGERLRVGSAEMPKAGEGEIIIRNRAVAVNPVSWKIQDTGMLVQKWPVVLDMDVAGEVFEVGAGIVEFSKGDRVVAWVQGPMSPDPRYGAFQIYTVAKAVTVAKIPTNLSFEEACVLPVAFSTALVSLFAPAGQGFGLPPPVLDPTPSSKVVVIWGASSSVGLLALQLARAAGIKTIAISSKRNFELCASCGAGATFDYHDSSVVDDVTGAVAAAGGEFVGILDCVSLPDQSLQFCIAALDKVGGGELGILLPHVKPHVSEKISVTNILGYNEMIFPFWKDYLTPALERGQVRCLPEALVVGSGLEALQRALDVQKEGVSAKKVVVAL